MLFRSQTSAPKRTPYWQCGNKTDTEVEEAALALAAAGDRIDKGRVARRVMTAIKRGRYRRLTKLHVTELLETAVTQRRIDRAHLLERIQANMVKSRD